MRSLVKKTAVLAALAAASPLLFAQAGGSSVQLYGIVDAAIRHTNHEGAAADGSRTQMIGGGMSQSRWGINVTEDLGGGMKALVNLENRFTTDDGAVASSTNYFQQSWVALQGGFGRITLGRQYNVLFDVVTTTYASFPYSPYMEAYKPEIGMSMGARASNMIKYTAEFGAIRGALQYSFDENNTIAKVGAAGVSGAGAVKTAGGYLRYGAGGIAAGGGYQRTTLPGGTKVDAWTLGGSWRSGPIYVNAGYGLNKRKDAYVLGAAGLIDSGLLGAYWSGSSNGGFMPGMGAVATNPASFANLVNHADKRQMYKVGFGYQVTPQINAGLHYYHARQSGSASGAFNGKANFLVGVVDYAFSKRTDAYLGVDHTRVSGGAGMALDANGARNRTGFTVGLRHRF
ncbi:porin [Melaminivora jejuensis]